MSYWQATGLKEFFPAQNNADAGRMSFLASYCLPFCLLFLALTGCTQIQNPTETHTNSKESSDTSPLESTASAPELRIDRDLATALDQLLNSPDFARARWGVAVVSLKDGKLIYEHNGDQLFTPASNMKIYTTAVGVDLLGADYRWRTSVYADSEPDSSGTLHGDLTLYGRGAPDLTATNKNDSNNSIEELAKMIAARGVRHIQGNVVGDESYFRGEAIGEGWQWNDLQWYFGAEASALSINANSVELTISSATKLGDKPNIVSNDPAGYIQTTNNLLSVERSEPLKLGVKRGLSDNNVTVWGEFPVGARGYGASLSVHRTSLWASMMLLRALKLQGITVEGAAQFRDSREAEKERFDPRGKVELAFVNSQSLGEIIKLTNKFSVNLYAELLLRTLGRERGAMLGVSNSGARESGDDEKGTSLVVLWLSRQGIRTNELAIHDGSGLSRLDLVTPRATAQLLEAIRKTGSGQVFTASLPIAGVDGTLQGRLKATNGRVAAKTGALVYDNSLSGYLTALDGEVFAFSVICNDFVQRGGSIPLIDRLLLAMSHYSGQANSPPQREKH